MNIKFVLLFLSVFTILRGLSLPYPALTDPTEGRYAAISKHLITQSSWVMPEINRGEGDQPFWGKPPMYFWLSAASIQTFGVSNVAARLVSLFSSILILYLTYLTARKVFTPEIALNAVAILGSSLTFYLLAGSSTIDVLLTFSVSGGLSMFFLCFLEGKKIYGYLGFIFLALAMLTKGPIGVLFVLVPFVVWLILSKNISNSSKIPWVSGFAVFIALTLPWFIIAEKESPGFLHYFFVNEHFLRFVTKDYGDKYGSSHTTFRGFIWVLAFGGFIPWTFLFFSRFSNFSFKKLLSNNTELFFVLWGLMPVLLFTPAKTVLFTYALPAFPGFAIFLSSILTNVEAKKSQRIFQYCRVLQVIVILVALGSISAALIMNLSVALYLIILGCLTLICAKFLKSFPIIPQTGSIIIAATTITLASLYSLINQGMSSVDIWRGIKKDPNIEITFVDKFPYSAQFYVGDRYQLKFVEPKDINYEKLKGDYIFSSLKKVDPKIREKAKTACIFGKWIYLDLEDKWKCENSLMTK